jgi:hypothetical protein
MRSSVRYDKNDNVVRLPNFGSFGNPGLGTKRAANCASVSAECVLFNLLLECSQQITGLVRKTPIKFVCYLLYFATSYHFILPFMVRGT